jgi:hypothetical protein
VLQLKRKLLAFQTNMFELIIKLKFIFRLNFGCVRPTDTCTAFSRSQLVVCLTQVHKLTFKLWQLQTALTDKLKRQVPIQSKFGFRKLYFAGEDTVEVSILATYFVKF